MNGFDCQRCQSSLYFLTNKLHFMLRCLFYGAPTVVSANTFIDKRSEINCLTRCNENKPYFSCKQIIMDIRKKSHQSQDQFFKGNFEIILVILFLF